MNSTYWLLNGIKLNVYIYKNFFNISINYYNSNSKKEEQIHLYKCKLDNMDTNIYILKYYVYKFCKNILKSIEIIRNDIINNKYDFSKSNKSTIFLDLVCFQLLIKPRYLSNECFIEYICDYNHLFDLYLPKNILKDYINSNLDILEKHTNAITLEIFKSL